MTFAPILLFTYNRPSHIRPTIEALQKNKPAAESELFIFSDGSKDSKSFDQVNAIRTYIKTVSGFKKTHIIEREKNYGLANNIIDGVTSIVNEFGKVIVLEDDLIASPYFLQYMNEGLAIYENDNKVISIHGYVYPAHEKLPETFFIKGADCLGWATWKRGWDLFEPDGSKLLKKLFETGQTSIFDFDNSYPYTQMLKDQIEGRNNSWAIRWNASAFLNDKYTLYPGRSLIYHAGGDGSGTNAGIDDLLDVQLSETPVIIIKTKVEQNYFAYNAFARFLKKLSSPSILYRMKRKFRNFFNSSIY